MTVPHLDVLQLGKDLATFERAPILHFLYVQHRYCYEVS